MDQEPIRGHQFKEQYAEHFKYLIDERKDYIRVLYKDTRADRDRKEYGFLVIREDVHLLSRSRAFRVFLKIWRLIIKDVKKNIDN